MLDPMFVKSKSLNFSSPHEALILQAANYIVCWFCHNIVMLVSKTWRNVLSSFSVVEYNIVESYPVFPALLFVGIIFFCNRIISKVTGYPFVDWC